MLYVETSAVLAVLFGQEEGDTLDALLQKQAAVSTSRLTLAETARVITRLQNDRRAKIEVVPERLTRFREAARSWLVIPIDDAVLVRLERKFPVEPVRTLDAIHLATIELLLTANVRLEVASCDQRVRSNCAAIGLRLYPAVDE